MLSVFSHLSDADLERAACVCKRWHYLANTAELWFFKLKRMIDAERTTRKQTLLIYELLQHPDIDMRRIYYELKSFLDHLKQEFAAKEQLMGKLIYIYYYSLLHICFASSSSSSSLSSVNCWRQ